MIIGMVDLLEVTQVRASTDMLHLDSTNGQTCIFRTHSGHYWKQSLDAIIKYWNAKRLNRQSPVQICTGSGTIKKAGKLYIKQGRTGRFRLFPTILFSDKIVCFSELPRNGMHKLERTISLKRCSFIIKGEIDRKSGEQVSRTLPPRMYGRNCDAVQVVDGESDECTFTLWMAMNRFCGRILHGTVPQTDVETEGDEIVFQARWTDEALEWIGVLNLVLLQM
jgi:hypothetical protein